MAESSIAKDYMRLKEKYVDEILLYQVGTFYRILHDDARKITECTGLKLMISGEAAAPVVMCGFPKSGLDKYIGKLLRSGFAVAVCNQLKDEEGRIARSVSERVEGMVKPCAQHNRK